MTLILGSKDLAQLLRDVPREAMDIFAEPMRAIQISEGDMPVRDGSTDAKQSQSSSAGPSGAGASAADQEEFEESTGIVAAVSGELARQGFSIFYLSSEDWDVRAGELPTVVLPLPCLVSTK